MSNDNTTESPNPPPAQELTQLPAPPPARRNWKWWVAKLVTPALLLAVGLCLIIALGVAQRLGWVSTGELTTAGAASGEAGHMYICPMHPQIRQPSPGRCPICGMPLKLTKSSGGEGVDELSIEIKPAQRRLADIQTAGVSKGTVVAEIETIGAVTIDESRMATIASYIDGRLERLFADYTGVQVAKGDHLAVIYSPELYSAQIEYLESRRALADTGQATLPVVRETQQQLATNSRQRLVELGMTEKQIARLEESDTPESRLTIYSPIGGTVIEKPAVEGKYVKAGDPIYRIADLSTIWLMLELYPEDAARIRFGQEVTAEVQSLPGQTFSGRVAFIDPTVDPETRTVGVRVEFLNENRSLRPGDYANAHITVPIHQSGEVYDADLAGRWISPMHPQIIRDQPGQCPICGMALVPTSQYGYSDAPVAPPTAIYIPRSALLMAGGNSVVYVETEPGRFEIRPIKVGAMLRDRVVILDGLAEGESVATSGNFLIDSQMQLAGKPSLIDPTKAIARKEKREGPLQFEHVHVTNVAGDAGRQIEAFYNAYFDVQRALASDKKPSEKAAAALHDLAAQLAANDTLAKTSRQHFGHVAEATEHLHHMKITEARKAFKPISRATVTLATKVRGSDGADDFTHFFCPHVKGGGDWLQPSDELRNPYYGSEMPYCGSKVHQFPARGQGKSTTSDEDDAKQEPDSEARED